MTNTAFINSAKLDFNNNLDFSPLEKITNFSRYNAQKSDEVLQPLHNQNIIYKRFTQEQGCLEFMAVFKRGAELSWQIKGSALLISRMYYQNQILGESLRQEKGSSHDKKNIHCSHGAELR